MIVSIVALGLIVTTIIYIAFIKGRPKVLPLLILILVLRLGRIVNVSFIIKLAYDSNCFYKIGTINDILSMILYSLLVGLSILLLVKEKRGT